MDKITSIDELLQKIKIQNEIRIKYSDIGEAKKSGIDYCLLNFKNNDISKKSNIPVVSSYKEFYEQYLFISEMNKIV